MASKRMLLQVKRGPHFMSLLDTSIRILESKLSRFFVKYPHGNVDRALQKSCQAWNNTRSNKLGMTPAEARNPLLDPHLRKHLFPKEGRGN